MNKKIFVLLAIVGFQAVAVESAQAGKPTVTEFLKDNGAKYMILMTTRSKEKDQFEILACKEGLLRQDITQKSHAANSGHITVEARDEKGNTFTASIEVEASVNSEGKKVAKLFLRGGVVEPKNISGFNFLSANLRNVSEIPQLNSSGTITEDYRIPIDILQETKPTIQTEIFLNPAAKCQDVPSWS